MDHLIQIEHASVSYPTNEGERIILNDISLNVRERELLAVVGPSGCGKSTALRLIQGSQFPTRGQVKVAGKQVERVNRDCGIVYQNYSVFPHMSVLDNVALGIVLEQTTLDERIGWGAVEKLLAGPDQLWRVICRTKAGESTWLNRLTQGVRLNQVRKRARAEAAELLSQCGLDPVRDGDKYPFELSGGMRQRVAIAQAIIMKPKVLLMDEPFGALDHQRREEMQDFIHEQWLKHGLTIFFVTHDLEEACKVGTRLICLSQHWCDESGKRGTGARILIDKHVVGGTIKPSEFSHSDEFQHLVESINTRGIKPNCLVPIGQRELTHPDAFISA